MNRNQWLDARTKGIGASDAACILGLNPWKSNTRLWEEKTGRRQAEDIGDKAAVQYGNNAESPLRDLFALDFPQYKISYDEFGMIANRPDEPWLFATLDGALYELDTGRQGVLEIKTTEIQRVAQWDEWKDRVPQHYYCQLLHQLLATGYDFAVLKAQIRYREHGINAPDGLRITTRHYYLEKISAREDMANLLKAETRFWEYVQNGTRPPEILPEI